MRRAALGTTIALLLVACSSPETPIEEAPSGGDDASTSTPPPSSCTDAVRNGDEQGIDCSGACGACDGAACKVDADCKSAHCAGAVCAAPPTKTCGVGTSVVCADGQPCTQAADCVSDFCTNDGRCLAAPATAHGDGVRNAGETDIDCGGTTGAPACSEGRACKTPADCEGVCTGGKCDAPTTTDGKKNGGETDVDCGGSGSAPRCAVDATCVADADCAFLTCRATKCVLPSSTNGEKDGSETDIDCGGAELVSGIVTVPSAPRCAVPKGCLVDADCESGVCADDKRCAEAPSCRPIRGGHTCGTGETGAPGAVHESCCVSYPVPGQTITVGGVAKQVYLDKYEITAGRVRAWLTAIRNQFGGEPNVQEWVRQRILTDAYLAGILPSSILGLLPKQNSDQPMRNPDGSVRMFKVLKDNLTDPKSEFFGETPPDPNNYLVPRDAGLYAQLGPTSFYRGVTIGGSSGCAMYSGGYGHRTLDESEGLRIYFGEPARDPVVLAEADDKSVNCMTPLMYAAFCAWDGGYLQTRPAIMAAYGPDRWPWGPAPSATLTLATERTFPGNFNFSVNTTSFTPTRRPGYNFPVQADVTWADDYTPLIAAPGRFPMDIASNARPGQPSWMDLGGNMIEWSQEAGKFYGWTGASWEGHEYPRMWTSEIEMLDKYGKSGARCIRLK